MTQHLTATPNLRGIHQVPDPVGAAVSLALPYIKALDLARGPGRPHASQDPGTGWRPAKTTTTWSLT